MDPIAFAQLRQAFGLNEYQSAVKVVYDKENHTVRVHNIFRALTMLKDFNEQLEELQSIRETMANGQVQVLERRPIEGRDKRNHYSTLRVHGQLQKDLGAMPRNSAKIIIEKDVVNDGNNPNVDAMDESEDDDDVRIEDMDDDEVVGKINELALQNLDVLLQEYGVQKIEDKKETTTESSKMTLSRTHSERHSAANIEVTDSTSQSTGRTRQKSDFRSINKDKLARAVDQQEASEQERDKLAINRDDRRKSLEENRNQRLDDQGLGTGASSKILKTPKEH